MLFILAGAAVLAALTTVEHLILNQVIHAQAFVAPLASGSLLGFLFFVWYRQNGLFKMRLIHLNLVLKTIRSVNRLLTQEKDRDRFIQGVCDKLVEHRGYYNAWIALKDIQGRWKSFFHAGTGQEFEQLLGHLQKGHLIACCQKALSQPGIVATDEPTTLCTNCPRANFYKNNSAISSRLEYNGQIYGVMTLCIAKEMVFDAEEQSLVQEIARDIAFGLYNIKLQSDREQSEVRFRELFNNMQSGVAIYQAVHNGKDFVLKDMNHAGEMIDAIRKEDFIGKRIADILPPTKEAYLFNAFKKVWQTGEPESLPARPYKGARVDGWREHYLYKLPSGELVVVYSDVTEQREAQKALSASERRFRTLIESALAGISIVQENEVVYQNKEQERLLGPLPRSPILGDYKNIHPDDVAKVKSLTQEITAGKIKSLDVDFRYTNTSDPAHPIWIHCRGHVIEYRQKESIILNMMDMTQIKRLESLLRMQDKMASLGRVTAGIAHEIRNPLSGINIYTNTLEKYINRGENDEKIKNVLEHMQSASRKIESIIRRVMDFAKPGALNIIWADINQPVAEAINLTAVTLRKSGVELEKALAKNPPKCRLDPTQIEEVILNLLSNAADAMRNHTGDKRIRVTTAFDSQCVSVRVIDSGPGVNPEVQNKIFDPFFTTKADSTGIGLSICHRIIVDHGGTIAVDKSQWGGAQFLITIPVPVHAPG
jgi:PAS domain S-box-containing protein